MVFKVIILRLFLLCLIWSIGGSCSAEANNGKLPRGRPLDNALDLKSAQNQAKSRRCPDVFWPAPAFTTYISADNNSLFFISKLKGDNSGRDYVLRFDPRTGTINKKLSFKAPANPALVPIGEPPTGFAVLGFRDSLQLTCGGNRTTAMGYRTQGRYQARNLLPLDFYQIYYHGNQVAVADAVRHRTYELDLITYQRRKGLTFAVKDTLLSYHPKGQTFAAVRLNDKNPLLVLYDKTLNTLTEVKLGNEYKVIRDRYRVLFVRPEPAHQTLHIRSIGVFNDGIEGRYRIRLPPSTIETVNTAALAIDSKNSRALVFNSKPHTGKRWRQAFVVDYKNQEILGRFLIPWGHYVSHAVHLGSSTKALFLLKDYTNHQLQAVKEFDFDNRLFRPVHLNVAF